MFEFIAAGIPTLASDLPEVRNFVLGQEVGMVGDMSSARKFAGLIDDFFADERRLAEWTKNVGVARKHVCWEQEEKNSCEFLRSCCEDCGRQLRCSHF